MPGRTILWRDMGADIPRFHFVLDAAATRWPDIGGLDEGDIACAPARFVGGRNSWIAQSFVRLRAAIEARGWIATAGAGFPRSAICIAHRDDVNRFASHAHAGFLVVVRADRAPVEACDLAIVQNDLAPERRERYVPLWPQPGLMPRDDGRATRIARIAYHGRTGSLPGWFTDPRLRAALQRRGVELDVRARGWEDYRQVDLVLAARRELRQVLAQKPATKLYNAWLAGVPALASPEPAYARLRRNALDFIEVHGPADVLAAIDSLRAHPRLYEAMVANGRERAAQFTVKAVRSRWMQFLEEDVLPAYLCTRDRIGSRRLWFIGAMARQKARSRAHRVRCGLEAWAAVREMLARRLVPRWATAVSAASGECEGKPGRGRAAAS
jgi:hypothetical protein